MRDIQLRLVQSFLERMKTVHAALLLRRGRSNLESKLSIIKLLIRIHEAAHSRILHPVLDPLNEIRDVPQHRTLVLHRARHALRDLDRRLIVIPHVTLLAPLRHGLDAPHPAVPLEPHPVLVEVIPRRVVRPGEHAPHHDAGGSQGQRLGDVSGGFDAAVGQYGHAVPPREFGDVVHGRRLGASHGAHLLRGADGSDAHAHPQAVRARLDQVEGLQRRHDVAGDHLQFGMTRLEMLHYFDLEGGVSLRRVHDDDVHSRLHQRLGPFPILRSRADGRAHQQLLRHGVLARLGKLDILQQIRPRDERDQLVVLVDDGKLTLLGLLQYFVGFREFHSLLGHRELFARGHDLAEFHGLIRDECDVAVGYDAHEFSSHFAGVGDGYSRVAVFFLQCHDVADGARGGEADWIGDETIFKSLHLANFIRLVVHREVGVDDSDAAL
mmetsp:Transcript_1984/g.4358  ORF Transcript_1984/g.4358 Transcript_1984/m.4358 type:complete len:438 (-) Transcript_1984:449-1762(-)